MSTQTLNGDAQVDCSGYVGKQPKLHFLLNWSGSCVLGSIHSFFFLLPLAREELLGAPVYKNWEAQRKQHALQIGN
jgi:hypothetical protein